MSGNVLHLLKKTDDTVLRRQIEEGASFSGEVVARIIDFLLSREVGSLEELSVEDVLEYRKEIAQNAGMKKGQKRYYGALLEQAIYSFLRSQYPVLEWQAEQLSYHPAFRKKVLTFLMLMGIEDANDIIYEIREQYEEYLKWSIDEKEMNTYIKVLDVLKLNAIKKNNEENPLLNYRLTFAEEKIFLAYHPDYEIAMSFYHLREKEELVFDFSLKASRTLKNQIFKMLQYVLDEKGNRHDRRERFLIPLKLFYLFCVDAGIQDVEEITERQIQEFRKSITGKVGTKTDTCMQIVDNVCKFLFISAKETNWKANCWFLDRFTWKEGRANPARAVRSFSFRKVEISENREMFKVFMKYEIGIEVSNAVETIKGYYYQIYNFMQYLDANQIGVCEITGTQMENYLKELDQRGNQPETFNRTVMALNRFYSYLYVKSFIPKMPVFFRYYYKGTFKRHNDRAVDLQCQIQILNHLEQFPMHLRLMFLNLWCVGLRISEVCTIKSDAYYSDGRDAWIRIYQNKMLKEKMIPIPRILYLQMTHYIEERQIAPGEYVFQRKNGEAYDAATFSVQFRAYLEKAGMTEYAFRAHDFRHTVATLLHTNKVSIETIRDYLGHKESDMTREYLDCLQELIDEENDNYFRKKQSLLTDVVTKEGEDDDA